MFREFAAENARRRNAANRDARHAYLIVHLWAVTKSKSKMPALDRYLVKDHATTPDSPEGKARRHLSALRVLSQQFGIPLRQGGVPVKM